MTEGRFRLGVAGGLTAARPDAVLAWAEARLAEAADAGADLLVLPQALLGEEAMLSDSLAVLLLAQAVARHRVPTVFGYVEHCSGRCHHAVQAIDAEGRALVNYRATHLAADSLAAGLVPGAWLNLALVRSVRIGLLADADPLAPELARALTLAGAVVLAAPAGLSDLPPELAAAVLRVRALENGCALAFASRGMSPPSLIVGPTGAPLASAEQGLAVAEVPLTPPAEAASRLAARRPLLYQRLTSPHPPDTAPRD
ncbi:MAG: nitrilase-related carbon-nitrogen hydrolase [Geminicoccaceae bacterium]